MSHLNGFVSKYYKEKNHRKLIQTLIPFFKHQDISLRLESHSYLVYFAKLCYTKDKNKKLPYCYRLFLIYQTLISVLCDDSDLIRRICIKSLFIWIITCSNDIICKDLRNNYLSLSQIGPLILSIVGISDINSKNRIVVFNQLNQFLINNDNKYISLQQWIQMFFKKPVKILDVESVTDIIPLFYKPILNNGKFLFLHSSFALCYDDLLNKINNIFDEKQITKHEPYLYIHIDSLIRNSCGLFSHVLDDEIRECRMASLNTLKNFVKYQINQIKQQSNNDNNNDTDDLKGGDEIVEIHVNVSKDDADNINEVDTSESKINFQDENQCKIEILSRALSFIADLLNDESAEVRSLTLNIIKEIMIFGSDCLRIGDDFLPLIQIMTGDYVSKTRIGAYQTLQYMHLSKPKSLLSCIKSLSSSIVRYPKDKIPLLYSLSILSFRHARLLEAILNELIHDKNSLIGNNYSGCLSVNNYKHLCLAIIIYYGCKSNQYLKENISSSITQFIDKCKLKHDKIFDYDMDSFSDLIVDKIDKLSISDNSDLLILNKYFKQLFQGPCNLKLVNRIIRSLHSFNNNDNNDGSDNKIKMHKFLSLWSILNDIFQLIELNVCGGFVCSKLLQLEHNCINLYKLCTKNKDDRDKFKDLAKLMLCLCCTLYYIVCNHNNKMDINKFILKIDDNFKLETDIKQQIIQQCTNLINRKLTLWQCIQHIWNKHFNDFNYMNCFKQYQELIHKLSISNQYKNVNLKQIIELDTEKKKIHFHPLSPMEISITCCIITDYAYFIKPKLNIHLKHKDGTKLPLKYHLLSTKQWINDLKSGDYITFNLQLPPIAISTNYNPMKNFHAQATIEMTSDHTHCALYNFIDDKSDIIISNSLSIALFMGFV